jgi:thymidylate synthase ThyX
MYTHYIVSIHTHALTHVTFRCSFLRYQKQIRAVAHGPAGQAMAGLVFGDVF